MTAPNLPDVPAVAGDFDVAIAKGYSRITTTEGRTLAYAMGRDYGVLLDFRTVDLEGAPKTATKHVEVKGARSLLKVNGKGLTEAKALLAFVAARD